MFYEELKQKIEDLLDKKQYRKALVLIEEELRAPYIPKDFEDFLKLNYKKLQNNLIHKPVTEPTLNIKQLKQMLSSNNQSQHLLALEVLDQFNLRLLMEDLRAFLLREDVANNIKSLILIAFQHQGIDEWFDILHYKERLAINPKALKMSELVTFNRLVVERLETTFLHKNRGLTNLAIKTALIFLLDFFPCDFSFSPEDVAAMALKRAAQLLNEKVTWKEITEAFPFNLRVAKIIFSQSSSSLD